MSGRRSRYAVGLAVVAAALTAATSGLAAMTATVGDANLIGRVALAVPVRVACDAPSPGLVTFSQSVRVTVEQPAGKGIARATADLGNFYPTLLFPCDGTATSLSVNVMADPTGPPFHGGKAVVRVTVTSEAGTPFPFSPGSFMSPFERQTTVVGPTEVRLR